MNNKWNKSRYICKSDIYNYKIIFSIILCIIVGMMYVLKETVWYNVGYICLNVLSVIYFVCRTSYIQSNLCKYNLELTSYSERIYRLHKYIVKICVLLILVLNIYYIRNINGENFKIFIWYATILPMLYSDSVYLSGITAFGDKHYASGEYLIKYDDIDQIKELREKDTIQGPMVLITLYKKGEEYGYDKMFIDEYQKLRINIFQNRGM